MTVLAGCGQGHDDPAPDSAARARLRRQALKWFKADLDAWRHQHAAIAKIVEQCLRHWQSNRDLAGVRDAKALEVLPEAERAAWRALWAEVDRLLEKSATTP
jgi:hypothetical protein